MLHKVCLLKITVLKRISCFCVCICIVKFSVVLPQFFVVENNYVHCLQCVSVLVIPESIPYFERCLCVVCNEWALAFVLM